MSKLSEKLRTVKDKFRRTAKLDETSVKRMQKAARAARKKSTQVGKE